MQRSDYLSHRPDVEVVAPWRGHVYRNTGGKHMYIHSYKYTYLHTYTHKYIHTNIHTCVYVHTYTHTYLHTRTTYVHTHILTIYLCILHTYINMYIPYICTYITYVHTHTHTHTHTWHTKPKGRMLFLTVEFKIASNGGGLWIVSKKCLWKTGSWYLSSYSGAWMDRERTVCFCYFVRYAFVRGFPRFPPRSQWLYSLLPLEFSVWAHCKLTQCLLWHVNIFLGVKHCSFSTAVIFNFFFSLTKKEKKMRITRRWKLQILLF